MRIALYAAVGLLLLLVAHLAHADLSAMFLSIRQPINTSRFDITRNTGTNFSFSADHLTATELTNASPGSNFSAFTTGFHSDVKRFFRFTIGNLSGGCTQEVGIASSTVANSTYLGLDNQSLGIQKTGGVIINNASIGNTGITYTTGDVIDLIVDPVAHTIQEVKNGGTPSASSSTAALGTQNVSPTISLCAINDSMVFNGNPPVSYSGAVAWDAPAPAPMISGVTATPGNFLTPSTNPVETLVANCSTGQCTSATFSLPSGATTGCTAPQVAQNNLFTISGNNLNAVSTINGSATENVGIVVTQAAASNSGTCYPLTLTGSPQSQGGPIHVVQGGSYGVDGGCYTSMGVTFSPVPAGAAIVGVFKTEDGFSCPSPNGSPDTVHLGSQQGTLLPRIQGPGNCCANQVPFVLFNASGASSTLTITSSNGGQFDGMGIASVITGFGSGASVDQDTESYYTNGVPTGTDAVTSPTITPSQSGDFLYGWLMSQYGDLTSEHAGTGWTLGANDVNIGGFTKHPALDENILQYNSTSPVAATFTVTNPSGEYAPGIIAIKPQ